VLEPDAVEITITRGHSAEASSPATATGPQWLAAIELRNDGPYDRFVFRIDRSPLGSDLAYEVRQESLDAGRRYRDGMIEWSITDGGLRDPSHWVGLAQYDLYGWTSQARDRFAAGFGPRYARANRVYHDVLDATTITRIGLGTICHVVNPTAEAPDGSIGINHLGRVVSATIVTSGGIHGARVAIELQPYPVDAVQVWGPVALAGVGSWDDDAGELTVTQDWAGVGGGHRDATAFVRPPWTSLGPGSLRGWIYQSEDGLTWDLLPVIKASVVTATDDVLELADLAGGVLLRDATKWVVAAPPAEQTAEWSAIYIPVTDPAGKYGAAKGKRL
jgi:hypothetical protein